MKCKEEVDRICKFIKDTVKDARVEGVVLGLSGGIDSAVVYKLCVNALGKDKVYPIFMPFHNTIYNVSRDRIKLLYSSLTDIYIKPIGGLAEFLVELPLYKINKVHLGNVQARLRMTYLYYYANLKNYLVIGTTNKSEYMIGYFTKYGDGGVDFEPIQHLYKTEVYKLAKYLKVPKEIIQAKPSADLWEGQTDEGEIGMSYEKLDEILKHLKPEHCWFNEWYSVESCQERTGFKREDIIKVKEMIKKSEHKRRLPKCLRSVTNAGK